MKPLVISRLTVIAFLLTASASVQAQAPSGSKEAEARFREGLAFAKQGKAEDAREKYLQSYTLDPRPSVLLSLAIVEQQLGRPLDAIRHLRAYLQSPQPPKAEELKTTLLRELEESTGHFRLKVPAGAELRLDGARVADFVFGDTLDVEPGRHTLLAGTERREASAARGQTVDVDFAPAPARAIAAVPVPHTAPPAETEDRWGTGQYVGVTAASAGVVAMGFGVGFLVASGTSSDRIAALEKTTGNSGDLCATGATFPQCQQLDMQKSERDRNSGLGVGLLLGGGVALAAGLLTFFVWPKHTSARPNAVGGTAPSSSLRPRPGGFELHF